jgi:nitrite reductase/ring-hydroxylating ferredoxin subunit
MERKDEDIKQIERGISEKDIKEMRELDQLFGSAPSQKRRRQEENEGEEAKRLNKLNAGMQEPTPDEDDLEEGDEDDGISYIKDPYAKSQASIMKHQEYRTIKIGPTDLLKNGQMIQVSVCDPFDEKTFHPTDKVVIAKHNGTYHATGSFCGFDYTNLATGALLGEKLICPTCGSTYNILNGFVD